MSGPLNITLDTDTAKTSVPLVRAGETILVRLAELSVDSNEKGQSLKWRWELVNPTVTSENLPLNPGEFGATIFETIPLYAKPDAKDPNWFVKKISARMDALLGTADAGNPKGKPTRPKFNDEVIAQLLGKQMFAKVTVKTGDFPGNDFQTLTFPGDVQQ